MERIINGKKVSLRVFVNDKLKPLYTQQADSYYVVYMQIVYDAMNTKLKVVNFEDPLLTPIAARKNDQLFPVNSELGALLERICQLYLDVVELEITEKGDEFELKNLSNVLFAYLRDYKTLVWERSSYVLMQYLGDHLTHNEWMGLNESSPDHYAILSWLQDNKPKIMENLPDVFQFFNHYKHFFNSEIFETYSLFELIRSNYAKDRFREEHLHFFADEFSDVALDPDAALHKTIDYGIFLKNS
jgi:hypothetical protein